MISFMQSQKFRTGLPTVLAITFLWLLIGTAEVGFDYLNFFQHDLYPTNYNAVSYTHLTLPTNREV